MSTFSSNIANVNPETSTFKPIRMLEVELSEPLSAISAYEPKTGRHYQYGLLLVRLHTRPLGLLELQFDEDGLSATSLAEHIWQGLQREINEHLSQDRIPEAVNIDPKGLPYEDTPRCLQERERFLAGAPFVSVVVPTRDRTELLATLLPSLLALEYPHYEIIVVDNAPRTSATVDFIAEKYGNLPQVRYVREDRPGLSSARNCGLWHAQGEIVAFADDDTIVDRHWLTESAKGFTFGQNVACVTGSIYPRELETPAQILVEQWGGYNKGFSKLIFDLAEHRPDNRTYPYSAGTFGSGANLSLKTSMFRDMGGFDPALSTGTLAYGGEELALFIQLITSGHQIVYEPGALLHHLHHREYDALKRQMYGYGVGLTACFMKSIIDDPKRIFDIGCKLPHGLLHILRPQSPKNRKKTSSYPAELTRLERKGMLYGPFAYLRSWWHVRQTTNA